MEKICLDTDVIVDFLRGDKTIVKKIQYYADREEICMTSNSLFQIMVGVKNGEALSAFINNISILDFGRKTAETAARIIDEARDRGKEFSVDNVITAATCIENNAFLFTKNRKDFEFVKGLKLV
ncbi:MAG: type II toxin-antitoxin system VapC family toxin [Candidatus Micrarchaeota archaeon]